MVDECVGRVVKAATGKGGVVMITADHGNAEEMWDFERGSAKTSHTTNPVEFIYLDEQAATPPVVRARGILSDIAPTVLEVMGLPQPAEMTCRSLLA